MGHHISGVSNSAKRRAAVAANENDSHESCGVFGLMQSRFGNLCSMAKEKAMEAEHSVEESIQHRPIMSILAALGVGAILGSLYTMACGRK
jgi:hypothetical protein